MTSSRINIRHTAGGVTIRATGAAAQALADAITRSADVAQRVAHTWRVRIRTDLSGPGFVAHLIVDDQPADQPAGLSGVCGFGMTARAAMRHLLLMATPPLRVVAWECDVSPPPGSVSVVIVEVAR